MNPKSSPINVYLYSKYFCTVLIHIEFSRNTIPYKLKEDCPSFGILPKVVRHFGKTLESNTDHDM